MPTKEQEDLSERMRRLEQAVFGDPTNPRESIAILPTMTRLSNYMDAACLAWRAVLLAVPTCTGLFGVGRARADAGDVPDQEAH